MLQILAFDDIGRFNHLDLLAEAVIVDVEQLALKPEYRFLDKNALFEICTCLVTLDGYDEVNLAHYSVKEYLISDRIQRSTAAAFQISPAAYHVLLAKTALVYLLDITYDGLCSAKDHRNQDDTDERDYQIHEKYNFPYLAEAHHWVDEVNTAKIGFIEVHDEAIIDCLVARLLNSNRARYQEWLESTQIYREYYFNKFTPDEIRPEEKIFPRWKTGPGLEASLALAYACYFNITGLAKRILDLNPDLARLEAQLEPDWEQYISDARSPPRTPLEMAIFYGRIDSAKLLLDRGADPNGINPDGDCRLLYLLKTLKAFEQDLHKEGAILPLLLKAGVDPNPRGVAFTPLQVAARYHDHSVVKILLEAGVYVNAVGDEEAIVATIQRDCSIEYHVDLNERIRTRGSLLNYQTPLRIAETASFILIRDILMKYGGESLRLFPIKDLPEEAGFCALSGSGAEEVEDEVEGVFETLPARYYLPHPAGSTYLPPK